VIKEPSRVDAARIWNSGFGQQAGCSSISFTTRSFHSAMNQATAMRFADYRHQFASTGDAQLA
jgi:hypothetical protein